jgi:hypothetical protein
MTEWRSLLRQVAGAAPLDVAAAESAVPGGPATHASLLHLAERWDTFRALCRATLREQKADALPELPPLTVEQRRPIQHRFSRAGGKGR